VLPRPEPDRRIRGVGAIAPPVQASIRTRFDNARFNNGEDALIPAWFLLQAASGPSPNPVLNFLPLILIFGIFYFLMLRPMSKQRKDQQKMISELRSGNVVLTNGGIIGTIVSLTDDTIILRVKPDNIKIQVARSAVSSRMPDES
jgi:preprotein translocase subunit YajC